MERFTIDDLRSGTMPWDTRVPTTPGIDPWCTRLAWQLSVHRAFGTRTLSSTDPDDSSSLVPSPDSASSVSPSPLLSPDDGLFVATSDWSLALRNQQFDARPALVPLDAVWGFASPFVLTTTDVNPFQIQQWAQEMAEVLLHEPHWELAFLTGLAPGSPLDEALLRALSSHVRLVGGEPTIRCIASLTEGADAFLDRRSRSFCRNLRQATARANAAGLTIESVDVAGRSGAEVIARLVAIETQSWKGREDSGITSPDMATLYTGLIDRLAHPGGHAAEALALPSTSNGIRLSVARLGGLDVGFILGGVIDGRYRGFQLSYAQSVRTLSVGNLLQVHEIRKLCQEGLHTYDLGMDMEYKRAWSDSVFTTRPIIAVRQ